MYPHSALQPCKRNPMDPIQTQLPPGVHRCTSLQTAKEARLPGETEFDPLGVIAFFCSTFACKCMWKVGSPMQQLTEVTFETLCPATGESGSTVRGFMCTQGRAAATARAIGSIGDGRSEHCEEPQSVDALGFIAFFCSCPSQCWLSARLRWTRLLCSGCSAPLKCTVPQGALHDFDPGLGSSRQTAHVSKSPVSSDRGFHPHLPHDIASKLQESKKRQ